MMKEWKKPEVVALNVKQTQAGGFKHSPDGTWIDTPIGTLGLGSNS